MSETAIPNELDKATTRAILDHFWLGQVMRAARSSLEHRGSVCLYPPTDDQYQAAAVQLAETRPMSTLSLAGDCEPAGVSPAPGGEPR